LEQAARHARGLPHALGIVAARMRQRGAVRRAAALYEEALELQPRNAVLLNNLADLLAAQGEDLARAERLAREALRLQPDRPELRRTLEEILQARKQGLPSPTERESGPKSATRESLEQSE
jgi:Tfp pilus assembly protein PilF